MSIEFRPIRLLAIVLSLVIVGTFAFSAFPSHLQANLKDATVGNVQHFDNH